MSKGGRPRKYKAGAEPWTRLGIPERTYRDYVKNPTWPADFQDQQLWIACRTGTGTTRKPRTPPVAPSSPTPPPTPSTPGSLFTQIKEAQIEMIFLKRDRERLNKDRDAIGVQWDKERSEHEALKRKIRDGAHVPIEAAYEVLTGVINPMFAELDLFPAKHCVAVNPDNPELAKAEMTKGINNVKANVMKVFEDARTKRPKDVIEEDSNESLR